MQMKISDIKIMEEVITDGDFVIAKPPMRPSDAVCKSHKSIFLGGSIEMGKAEDWQTKLTNDLKKLNAGKVVVFNPRRDDWDSSWKQEIGNKQFNEQVTWELDYLDKADIVVLYFDPKTKSPITLMELGLHANDKNVVVCCPEGFFRKGNVDIVCKRFGIKLTETYDELLEYLTKELT